MLKLPTGPRSSTLLAGYTIDRVPTGVAKILDENLRTIGVH